MTDPVRPVAPREDEELAVAMLAACEATIRHLWDIAARFDTKECNLIRDEIHRLNTITLPAIQDLRAAAPVPCAASPADPLTFAAFSEVNRRRCEDPQGFNHALSSWSTSDWFVATVGELGEAANIVKKLNRYRDGVRGNKESEAALRAKLRSELADVFIYLDLIFQACGFDASEAVIDTFDAKSAEIGYPVRLRATGEGARDGSDRVQRDIPARPDSRAADVPLSDGGSVAVSIDPHRLLDLVAALRERTWLAPATERWLMQQIEHALRLRGEATVRQEGK